MDKLKYFLLMFVITSQSYGFFRNYFQNSGINKIASMIEQCIKSKKSNKTYGSLCVTGSKANREYFLIKIFAHMPFTAYSSEYWEMFFAINDINQKDEDRLTILHRALAIRDYCLVKFFLQHHADPNIDYEGISPLQLAKQFGEEEIAELLIEYGAIKH